MQLQINQTETRYVFNAYGEHFVSAAGTRHTQNIALMPDRLITNWTNAEFNTLKLADFEFLVSLNADIILLGTGKQLRFPPPELLQPLVKAQKSIEVMDIHAACRTYNMLVSEGRHVLAALLFS